VVIVPLNGGSPVKVFPLPESASNGPSAWSPDGRAIAFVNNVNGVGNIWQQPVDGGKATPVTNLTSGSIFNFQWSRAGWLILSRGTQTFDAVLIRNFQPDGIHTR
jgi:Tol biopolymer transport system component